MRVQKLYAVFDVQMQMWTSPVVFRNDTEAKRCFNAMKERNDFNDCEVEFYCLGEYVIDANSNSNPIVNSNIRRLYIEATVEDGAVDVVQPVGPGIGAEACSFDRHDF